MSTREPVSGFVPVRHILHAILRVLRGWLESAPEACKVRWSIDVDPVEMM